MKSTITSHGDTTKLSTTTEHSVTLFTTMFPGKKVPYTPEKLVVGEGYFCSDHKVDFLIVNENSSMSVTMNIKLFNSEK